jgi:hypothetical protein
MAKAVHFKFDKTPSRPRITTTMTDDYEPPNFNQADLALADDFLDTDSSISNE